VRETVEDYDFPERIVLDEASLTKLGAELEGTPKPAEALRATFRR